MNAITVTYWRPVYKYVRVHRRLEREDAEDFTQEFFARLLEKEFLNSYKRAGSSQPLMILVYRKTQYQQMQSRNQGIRMDAPDSVLNWQVFTG